MTIFHHITVGTDDLSKSKAFYDASLGELGLKVLREVPELAVFYGTGEGPAFAVLKPRNGEPACYANGGTIAFTASSREAVRKFHAAGQAAGGSDEGAPGNREAGPPGNYVAYLHDPFGNKIAAVTYATDE